MTRSEYEKIHVGHGGFKHLRLRSGRRVTFLDAEREMKDARQSLVRWTSRAFKLATQDWDEESLRWFIDDMETLVAAWKAEIEKRAGVATKKERIAQLREVAGRTDEERAIYLAKADELERELDD